MPSFYPSSLVENSSHDYKFAQIKYNTVMPGVVMCPADMKLIECIFHVIGAATEQAVGPTFVWVQIVDQT